MSLKDEKKQKMLIGNGTQYMLVRSRILNILINVKVHVDGTMKM